MYELDKVAQSGNYRLPENQMPVNNNGVVNLSKGIVYDIYTIPTSFSVTISSTNAGTAKTVYAFNTDVLNAAVTDNGGGAGTIVTTYGDGFSGRVYNRLTEGGNAAHGVRMKGLITQVTNYTSGAQTATAYNTLQMQLLCANGEGGTTPVPINPGEAVRNVSNQVGILTVVKEFYLNGLNQLSFSLPINTIIALTLITEKGSLG